MSPSEHWRERAERAEEALRRIGAASEPAFARPVKVENEFLRQQLQGAVARGDWFRQAWANAQGCSLEAAERAYETLGDITAREAVIRRYS